MSTSCDDAALCGTPPAIDERGRRGQLGMALRIGSVCMVYMVLLSKYSAATGPFLGPGLTAVTWQKESSIRSSTATTTTPTTRPVGTAPRSHIRRRLSLVRYRPPDIIAPVTRRNSVFAVPEKREPSHRFAASDQLQLEPPALLADTSNGVARALLTATERAAIVARQDVGTATVSDWTAYSRDLDARLQVHGKMC